MNSHDQQLNSLLNRFVKETPGVQHAQAVSVDGMHLASSTSLDAVQCDTFAAIASGLSSLSESASDILNMKTVVRQIVETTDGWILISRISSRASLAVATGKAADLGLVGYEMTVLGEQAGEMLSPDVVATLKNSLAV